MGSKRKKQSKGTGWSQREEWDNAVTHLVWSCVADNVLSRVYCHSYNDSCDVSLDIEDSIWEIGLSVN